MKNIFLGLGTLALLLGASLAFTNSASAFRGDPNVKGPNYSVEHHTAMQKALETNDYNTWANLMQGKGRVTQVINKDNFAKFTEAYKLAKGGDLAGAQKIRQDLGLGLKNGSGKGMGNGLGRGNCMNR
jgi:hypothetical protein